MIKDLELSSSESSSDSSDGENPSNEEGEIVDNENKKEKMEEEKKENKEEESDEEDVKRYCQEKLSEVKRDLAVEYKNLIEMREAAEEARVKAEEAEVSVAQKLRDIQFLQEEKARLQVPNIAFHLHQSVLFSDMVG